MSPDPALLKELVCRILSRVAPRQIILFGSAARGEMGPRSDLDVLIVMPDGCDCRLIAKTLHRQLRGLDAAKDILVVEQSAVEKYRHNPYLIIQTAVAEGKELYHAAS